MDVNIRKEKGVAIAALVGRLDSVTSGAVQQQLETLVAEQVGTIIIDFSETMFLSSAGLRVLLVISKQVKVYGGGVQLAGMSAGLQEIFDISGFASIFTIHGSSDEALAANRVNEAG